MAEYYDEEGRPYWSRICPFCGEREAVRFEDGLLRACRGCGAKWLEWRGLVRLIEPKCDKVILESSITGVHHIPWRFVQAQSAEEPKAIETTVKEETQMSRELQVFSFEEKKVRVVMKSNTPWWVAKDVCDVLGLTNAREAIKALDDDEKSTVRISDGAGGPERNAINESGMYALIMRSNKPEAKRFRKWVTSEVLPQLRKTGEYATPAAKKRKADKDDELALRRIEVMEKNADYRMAKLILEGIDKFKDVMTPESKIVFMAKYGELTAKHDMTHMLPPATEKWYSATELGTEFGVSARQIGKTANENDLKAPEGESNQYGTWIRSKSQHSSREVMTWVYYEAAREWFARYFKERKTA